VNNLDHPWDEETVVSNDRNIATRLYLDSRQAETRAARFARRAIAQIAAMANWLRRRYLPTPCTNLLRGYRSIDGFLAVNGNYDALRALHHRTVLQVHAANEVREWRLSAELATIVRGPPSNRCTLPCLSEWDM